MSKDKERLPGPEPLGAATPVADKKEKRNLMYLGPTIVGVARHGTVFKGGILPAGAQECIAKFPPMSRLFVRLDEMPRAARQLKEKQGTLWAVYAQVEQKFTGRE